MPPMKRRRDGIRSNPPEMSVGMKARKLLSATELHERREFLSRQLESIGLETQPQVAIKILELNGDPKAQLKDYAGVVKTDPALSGRLLKLANSAMFAQRKPVTSLDRACLLLGLERLKAISLGFQLGRAAAAAGQQELSRKVWGQNVFRACVASESAKVMAPSQASEAFVVGLMMDAGIPLMARLIGPEYMSMYEMARTPAMLYAMEFENLPYTHVDVMCAMGMRWRLPDVLLQPIAWHHMVAGETRRAEGPHRLHQIAYGVGMVSVPSGSTKPANEEDARNAGLGALQRLLGIGREDAELVLTRAVAEYGVTSDMFSGIAQSLGSVDDLAERVHLELVEAFDTLAGATLVEQERAAPQRFVFGEQRVEIAVDEAKKGVACLLDSGGHRLMTYRFDPKNISVRELFDSLGMEDQGSDTKPLEEYLRRLAA